MLDIQIAIAKTNKYAIKESGDTVEVVERPHGGFSVALVDGQGSGPSAKSLSHFVTGKAIGLIKDGVRDGTVARSVHDALYAYRGGKVSATLTLLSVDIATQTLVISRNSHCPVLLLRPQSESFETIEDQCSPIGLYPKTRPSITELPLEANTYIIAYTDGLMEAGKRAGAPIDLAALATAHIGQTQGYTTARSLTDCLLQKALTLDANRPSDDMTVAALAVHLAPEPQENRIIPQVRRMELHMTV